MDISGAQINSAVLDAVSAQAQPAAQNNRPAPAPAQQQPSAEVTLSRDARERATQTSPERQPPAAANVSSNPVQAPDQAQSAHEESSKNTTTQARENESHEQQANVAIQAQTTAATYTARIAAQSYTSVSNF